MKTYAEQAAERLSVYARSFAGDWWNDCIAGEGYAASATDHVDNNASEIALYADGSYIVFDGQAWGTGSAEVGDEVTRTTDAPGAVWMGDHWMLTEC